MLDKSPAIDGAFKRKRTIDKRCKNCYNVCMPENESNSEPKPIGEILENPEDVIQFQGDPDREAATKEADLEDERQDLQQEAADLIEEIEAGRAGPDAESRLEQLKNDMVNTDADIFEARRKQGGKKPD
jgi:hypothetical protein